MKQDHDISRFLSENLAAEGVQQNETVNPIFPQMFASGTFINSFAPKTEMENMCIWNAIKEFKCNYVIVVDDMRQKLFLQDKIREDPDLFREAATQIIFINKPQGVTSNQTDAYFLYQEYFRGKNYELMQHKEQILQKINNIKFDVDKMA